MWTTENRRAYERTGLRYPSDLTDAEWALVEPLIPPAKRGGRPRTVDVRAVLNAIFYVLSTGCRWRALPKDFPPRSSVYEYLELWNWDGTLLRIHHALYVEAREQRAAAHQEVAAGMAAPVPSRETHHPVAAHEQDDDGGVGGCLIDDDGVHGHVRAGGDGDDALRRGGAGRDRGAGD